MPLYLFATGSLHRHRHRQPLHPISILLRTFSSSIPKWRPAIPRTEANAQAAAFHRSPACAGSTKHCGNRNNNNNLRRRCTCTILAFNNHVHKNKNNTTPRPTRPEWCTSNTRQHTLGRWTTSDKLRYRPAPPPLWLVSHNLIRSSCVRISFFLHHMFRHVCHRPHPAC